MSYSTGLWDSTRYGVGAFYFDPALSADFSAIPLIGTIPLTVSFTDLTSGSPTSWLWDFGDSTPLSSVQNPTHVYTVDGVYTVILSATNDGGTSVCTKTNYISAISATGHIGAFYFGPIYESITADTAIINIIGCEPEVSAIVSVSANIVIPTASIIVNTYEPNVYTSRDISIDFSGVPVIGTSPLVVRFNSWITFKGEYTNMFKVKEWIWYFDYDNNPTIYEKTTSTRIYHVFKGYKGQKFSVKLEVILEK